MPVIVAPVNAVPYVGTKAGQLVYNCLQSKYPPKTVVIAIDWQLYPGGAVSINLEGASGVINPIDMIQSIAINNSAISLPVNVTFQDTNYTVSCEGQGEVTVPIISFQLKMVITCDFRILSPPFNTPPVGTTLLYFNNFPMEPGNFSQFDSTRAYEFLTPLGLSSGGAASYSPRALGDRNIAFVFDINDAIFGAGAPILPDLTGTTSVGYRITEILISAVGVYTQAARLNLRYRILFSTLVFPPASNSQYFFNYLIPTNPEAVTTTLFHMDNLQLDVPNNNSALNGCFMKIASLDYPISNTIAGKMLVNVQYTRIDKL